MIPDNSKAVFLSYASQDAEAAKRICEALRAAGVEVWFDQNELVGGDAWDAKIRGQIKACALFVPIISAATQARGEGYFRLEWKLAIDRSHLIAHDQPFLLPVVIDATSDAGARVPPEFRTVQWTRLPPEGDGGTTLHGKALTAFCERVRTLLAADSTPRSASSAGRRARPEEPASPFRLLPLAGVAIGAALIAAVVWRPWEKTMPSGEAGAVASAQTARDAKSVAVLAFANASDDKANEYFSDGISEDLLNVLAKVPELKVIARASAFHFKGKNLPIPEIARQLGVAYIVDGSVRRSGDKVRIYAQLIKAADGFQVWSDTFTRDLKDVFAVQDEIAGLVAKKLSLTLGTNFPPGAVMVDPEAFRLYLEGRQEWNKRSPGGFKRAEVLFEEAIARDPKLARAYVGLADTLYFQSREAFEDGELVVDGLREIRARVLSLLERALALDSSLAEAHVSRAQLFQRNEAEREAGLRRGLELNPSYATGHHWLALSLARQGKLEAAVAEANLARQLDPFSPAILGVCTLVLNHSHRWSEALEMAERALALQPDFSYALGNRVRALLGLGRRADALALLRANPVERRKNGGWLASLAAAGDRETAGRHAAAIFADEERQNPLDVFQLYVALGRTDEALDFLERRATGVLRNVGDIMAPMFDEVRKHPRFSRALAQAGMAERYARAEAELAAGKKRDEGEAKR